MQKIIKIKEIKKYIVDDEGNEYLCEAPLAYDIKEGYVIKAKVDEENKKILHIILYTEDPELLEESLKSPQVTDSLSAIQPASPAGSVEVRK